MTCTHINMHASSELLWWVLLVIHGHRLDTVRRYATAPRHSSMQTPRIQTVKSQCWCMVYRTDRVCLPTLPRRIHLYTNLAFIIPVFAYMPSARAVQLCVAFLL
jgi:hypothetical protein